MVISNYNRGWLLLVPLVPSIIVSIFNLYHLLSSRALRTAINNHAIILLLWFGLILELTDVTWLIYFYFNNIVLSQTPAFCLAWVFLGVGIFSSISILMAWASIERHIIIFHQKLVATARTRFIFHYFPLAIAIIWPLVFYCVMLLILPCANPYYYNRKQCSRYGCIILYSNIALMDSIAHYIMPAFVTVTFSVALLARVIYKRYRFRGRIDWRNYRKMAGQLLPISALYILLQLPPMTMYAAYSGGLARTVAADYYTDSLFFNYWVVLFTPFVSIFSLPDLGTKCRNLFLFWRRKRTIHPVGVTAAHRKGDPTVAVVAAVQ